MTVNQLMDIAKRENVTVTPFNFLSATDKLFLSLAFAFLASLIHVVVSVTGT